MGQELDQNAQPDKEATSLPTRECDNPLHIQALNYRAGTFEKIGDLRRALADARRMMDVAPCSPEVCISLEQPHHASQPLIAYLIQGYLRASKILRMDKKPVGSLQILTDGILIFLERGDFQVDDLRVRLLILSSWL